MSVTPDQLYRGSIGRPVGLAPKIGFLHFLLLATLAVAVLVWGATLIVGVRGHDLMKFISLAGFFGVACAFFVVSRMGSGFQSVFEVPVFMTLLAILEFGLAPLRYLLDPSVGLWKLHGDTSLFHPALQIVIIGIAAFWLGSELARSRKPALAPPDRRSLAAAGRSNLTLGLGAILYLVSFAAKVYLVRTGLFGWLVLQEVYYSNLAEAQVLGVVSGFGLYALILFCIEAYFHPEDKFRGWTFWAVFASECVWGLISGMKAFLLSNLLALALVSSFAKQKLRLRWLALVILGLIAIYPLVTRYRTVWGGQSSDPSTRFAVATQAMREAAGRSAARQETAGDYLQAGWSASVDRVNLLGSIALLMAYKDQAYRLEGDERLWMLPFYPLVPRFIWRDKPILNIAGRFTQLLGGGAISSTALTFPGDLYVCHNGIAAVLVGMFVLGLVAQWLTNPIKLHLSKRSLFIYACLFFSVANWEGDAFGYSGGLIRAFVIVQVLALILYGPARPPLHLGVKKNQRDTEAQRKHGT